MKIILIFFGFILSTSAFAQKIDGQWRGFFDNNGDISVGTMSGTDKIEYVLELEIKGTKVSGYSYSYFNYYPEKYYVICEVNGTYNPSSKLITANEVKRIKGYTPEVGWDDCLQTHILTYYKQAGKELLEGTWRKSPYENSDCGVGKTTLQRKVITNKIANNYNKKDNRTIATTPKPKTQPPVATTKPKITPQPPIAKVEKKKPVEVVKPKIEPKKIDIVKNEPPKKVDTKVFTDINNYEKRNNKLVQTIEVKKEKIKVEFYDNGDIDGDTISVFFNGKLLLAHQRLSQAPLTVTLNADDLAENNELIMYADNLGEIPPNTAVMVVTTASGKRYEVRIASDLKQSGTIRFVKTE